MNNRTLFRKCVMYGKQSLKARRKFLGFLPEVGRRRLFERKGYGSIYEFAAKLAGVSKEQVNRVLNLEQKYSNKPLLLAELTNGRASINKLIRVAHIATVENQAELIEKTRLLSSRALEVFVKDLNGSKKPLTSANSAHVRMLSEGNLCSLDRSGGSGPQIAKDGENGRKTFIGQGRGEGLELDDDIVSELCELQEKGIDVNVFLRKALTERKEKIQSEKVRLSAEEARKKEDKDRIGKPTSRRIPAEVVRVVRAEYGTKCSMPNCGKLAEHFHHEQEFAKWRSHSPEHIKPLCKGHHELQHYQDSKFQKHRQQYFP